MGQEVGDSCLAWAWGPLGNACIANSPSGLCKGAAFFGFVTTPPPQFANCKLRQSQLRLAKERRLARRKNKFEPGRPWEDGKGWRSKAWTCPPSLDSRLADPSPRAPLALQLQRWEERRISSQTWGARTPSQVLLFRGCWRPGHSVPPPSKKFPAQSGQGAPPPS